MSGLIVPFKGFVSKVASSAFIAPNATLIADVEIAAKASIWFGVILRGDGPGIRIGENSNLQDGTVVYMALLHACELQDGAFVGMHSSVLDGAVVESEAMVAAGAVVTPGKIVRRGELWAGNPAQKLRDLSGKDFETFRLVNAWYVKLSRDYMTDAGAAARAAE